MMLPPAYKDHYVSYSLTKLYEKEKKYLAREQNNLFTETLKLTNTSLIGTISVYWEGHTHSKRVSTDLNKQYVDAPFTLKSRYSKLYKRKENLIEEKIKIKAYFKRLLNLSTSYADINALLPSTFKSFCYPITPVDLYDAPIILTDTRIKVFNSIEQQSIDLIKQRLLLNVLIK